MHYHNVITVPSLLLDAAQCGLSRGKGNPQTSNQRVVVIERIFVFQKVRCCPMKYGI